MKERSVREDSIKAPVRQLKPVEILLPNLASAVGPRHGSKAGCPLQADRRVAQFRKSLEDACRDASFPGGYSDPDRR